MSDFEPKQFGKYLLLQKIAVGGMAEIYRAKTYGVDGFEKELVIKRILPHFSADKDFITMLVDEAKLSVMLSHANIVQVYDLSKVGDDYYIAMELIRGVNLREIMYHCRESGRPLLTDISVYIASEICKGLDYAHRKTDQDNQPLGIVHRDISPQNILISYEGEVKIVDFGIAKAAMNISHTMAGILKGKIAYMSPEQAMGKPVDRRTDIFSSGILLYEMLTGTKLFTGESQFEVLKKIRTTRITEAMLPNTVPEQLKPIVAKALAYHVDERYQHAGDFQIELTKYLYSNHIDFSPRKLAAAIRDLCADELKKEQAFRAREGSSWNLTATMNVEEGAKQVNIVRREEGEEGEEGEEPSVSEDTARTGKPSEAFLDTMVTPVHEQPRQPSERPPAPPPPKAKKGRSIFKPVVALSILALIAYGAFKFIPAARFWEAKPAAQVEQKPGVPATPTTAAQFGSIRINSTPDGAKVFLDGVDTGRVTPTVIEQLESGKTYKVRTEKQDYGPAESSVRIAGGEVANVALMLQPPSGALEITSEPAGASISVDGRPSGKVTPATIEGLKLNADLRILLSKPDYGDFEQVVNLSSSKPQSLKASLMPAAATTGKVAINSTPSGATVLIDGTDTGRTTPTIIDKLSAKKYSVSLKMDGYDEWSGAAEVKASQQVSLEARLNKKGEVAPPPTAATQPPAVTTPTVTPPVTQPEQPMQPPVAETKPPVEEKPAQPPAEKKIASLRVTSTPPGAKIFLDGAPTGKSTPATIDKLDVGGSYKVRLDLDGYKSATKKKGIAKESDALAMVLEKEEVQKPATPTEKIPPPTPAEKLPSAQQKPEKPVEAAPSGKAGSIKISSNPSGADVFINTEFKGKTPLTASVPAGQAQVVINMEGRARVSKSVTVRPGETVNLSNIELGDVYGEVSLNSEPPAAQVIFDGQAIPARTPVTIRKVRRDRPHSVTIQMPGYKPWSNSFSLDSSSKSFNVTLQPQ